MKKGGISVIIPARNYGRFLGEAIGSVLEQDEPADEIVVIDDGSTDNTREVVRACGDRVRHVWQEAAGIAAARNRGLEETTGEWVAFLDADDIWTPGKLRRQKAWFREHPEGSVCTGRMRYFLEAGHTPPPHFRAELWDREVDALSLTLAMIRREAFERVGVFDPAFRVGEDTDWFARARDGGEIFGTLPEVLVRVRVHGGSATAGAVNARAQLFQALRNSTRRKSEASL